MIDADYMPLIAGVALSTARTYAASQSWRRCRLCTPFRPHGVGMATNNLREHVLVATQRRSLDHSPSDAKSPMNNPFRKSTPVEGVMRLALQAVFRRDFTRALAQAAAGGILRPEDITALKSELPAFEIAVWQMWFLQAANVHAPGIPSYEVGRRFGLALGLAAADIRTDKEQAITEVEALLTTYGMYLEACGQAHSATSTMDDGAFAMIQALAGRVLPDIGLQNASDSDRRHQVIIIGRDSYRMIEAGFAELTGQWQLAYT